MNPLDIKLVKTGPIPRGSVRVVEVTEEGKPLAREPVAFIEPLLEHRRTEAVTDSSGRCAYEQPHENDGALEAPRPFQVEVKGRTYPID